MKKKSLFLSLAVAGAVGLVLPGFQDVQASIVSDKTGINIYDDNEDVQKMLERKWNEVIEAYDVDESQWNRYEHGDFKKLQENPPEQFSANEIVSIATDAVPENITRKAGDSEGIYLIHKTKKKGLYIFQREDGTKVMAEFEIGKKTKNATAKDQIDNPWSLVEMKEK